MKKVTIELLDPLRPSKVVWRHSLSNNELVLGFFDAAAFFDHQINGVRPKMSEGSSYSVGAGSY